MLRLRLFYAQFSRETILLNKILGKIRLRLCKDCQKLTSSRDLRCKNCRIEHDESLRERLTQEYQEDLRAEWEAENEAKDQDDQDEDY